MYVCQTITFDSLDVGSSFSLIWYIFREYGSSSYMKVIVSRSRSQEQKSKKSLLPQYKTSLGNKFASATHRTVKFAGSMGFSATVDGMV